MAWQVTGFVLVTVNDDATAGWRQQEDGVYDTIDGNQWQTEIAASATDIDGKQY